MSKVAIIGAGMMGTALSWPLHDNHHEVRLVGTPLDDGIIQSIRKDGLHPTLERTTPPGIQAYTWNEMPAAIEGVDLIVNGVSSFGIDWFSEAVGPLLSPDVPVLSVTKGLEVLPNGDVQPLTDYIDSRLPVETHGKIPFIAIAGPCIAHELAARRETCVVFGGRDPAILSRLRGWLETPYYRIWTSTDLKEIEICAALKNGYALGVSIAVGLMDRYGADGLAHMYNPQAAVFAQSCLEMRMLIRAMHGNEDLVSWLPGAGDLYVTVFGGRTLHLGRLIGQGHPIQEALEMLSGVTLESVEIIGRIAEALPRLEERHLISQDQFPLLRFLQGVITAREPIRYPWDKFFSEIIRHHE
jgi:glycerol-3-phosphate dehydrogenase (NAD(P)+)